MTGRVEAGSHEIGQQTAGGAPHHERLCGADFRLALIPKSRL